LLKRVDRILMRVPSLEGAITYYRDTLGLKLVRRDKGIACFMMAEGETEIVLHTDPDLPDGATYFLVEDVRDLYRRRRELGLTFVSKPAPSSRGFRATVKDEFGTVLLLIDRSTAAGGGESIEDAKPPGALFAGVDQKSPVKREPLVEIYQNLGRTADDLPYTPHFETLYSSYISHFDAKPTRQEVWRHLLNLRKAGNLPKLGEAKSKPPKVSDEARTELRALLGDDIGKRDRLPYTPRFDDIVNRFNETQPRRLSPHLVWRLVATLAK
jgi:catechol 2,3-dioxygenase-like lactoylglutathione lyase family enzyme